MSRYGRLRRDEEKADDGTATIKLRTTTILELLRAQPGRHVGHDAGYYRMKEVNDADVIVTENGRQFLVEPDAEQIDDLVRAGHLVRKRSKVTLNG